MHLQKAVVKQSDVGRRVPIWLEREGGFEVEMSVVEILWIWLSHLQYPPQYPPTLLW